jgi:Flp pilus assembly protein TadB
MDVHRITAVLLSAVALALAGLVAAPSPAPARAALPALNVDAGATVPLAARGARGGFRSRSRSVSPRANARQRAAQRARNRSVVNNVLRFLGIAWLASVLFGIGSGGSPLGLLLVGAFVLWLVVRSRRARERRRGAFGY